MYDLGPVQNLERYNSTAPPSYHVKNIVAPVVLYYGSNDRLSAVTVKTRIMTVIYTRTYLLFFQDVEHLRDELPNVVKSHLVNYEKWNHLDYLWAIEVNKYLYNNLVKTMIVN